MGPKRDYSFYDHRHQENHPVTKNFPINQSRYQPANPSLPGNLGSPEKMPILNKNVHLRMDAYNKCQVIDIFNILGTAC